MFGVVEIFVIIAIVAVYFLVKAYAPVVPADVAAMHVLTNVPAGPRTDRLFRAYLSRARRYRSSWSVAAWMTALVLAIGFGATQFGIGGDPDRGVGTDLLLMGISGYLAGAIVAELHHLRRPRTGARVATLTPRTVRDYRPRRAQWLLRILVLAALVVFGIGIVCDRTVDPSRIGSRAAFLPGMLLVVIAIVAVWGVVELTQRAIVLRPRPAMPDELAAGDDAIRGASVRTLALGGSGLLCLLLVWEVAVMNAGVSHREVSTPSVVVVCNLAAFGLFFAGCAFALRARRIVWPQRKLKVDGVAG